jgi:hypothetical protein
MSAVLIVYGQDSETIKKVREFHTISRLAPSLDLVRVVLEHEEDDTLVQLIMSSGLQFIGPAGSLVTRFEDFESHNRVTAH